MDIKIVVDRKLPDGPFTSFSLKVPITEGLSSKQIDKEIAEFVKHKYDRDFDKEGSLSWKRVGEIETPVKANISENKVDIYIATPKRWGMSTYDGNYSLKEKGNKLVEKLNKASTVEEKKKAFSWYFSAWKKMFTSKTMSEAKNKDVEDAVYGFAKILADKTNIAQTDLLRIKKEILNGK